jgi:hypothetical protein
MKKLFNKMKRKLNDIIKSLGITIIKTTLFLIVFKFSINIVSEKIIINIVINL